jgi:hypothetical protein
VLFQGVIEMKRWSELNPWSCRTCLVLLFTALMVAALAGVNRLEANEARSPWRVPDNARNVQNLIGKRRIKLVVAPNCLIPRHASSSAGGDVSNLLGFTVSALYSHFDLAYSGTGHFQCHDLRFLLPTPNPTRSKM